MLTLTDAAQKELEGFFADREKATVRIYLAPAAIRHALFRRLSAVVTKLRQYLRLQPMTGTLCFALSVLPSASTMNFCSR